MYLKTLFKEHLTRQSLKKIKTSQNQTGQLCIMKNEHNDEIENHHWYNLMSVSERLESRSNQVCQFEKVCFEKRIETKERVNMPCGREFQRRGAEQLNALDPLLVKRADGVVSWTAGEYLRVQVGLGCKGPWAKKQNLEIDATFNRKFSQVAEEQEWWCFMEGVLVIRAVSEPIAVYKDTWEGDQSG